MKIWIDLAGPPQVLFFRPILRELQSRECEVFVTTRHYSQTISLADSLGINHHPIGDHGGVKVLSLARSLIARAFRLISWARHEGFDLAVSHNSYAQALAATRLRIPFVTLMDYEHQPLNNLAFRLARRVIVPECFPDEMLYRYGASGKAGKYHGIKEQVYLSDFVPEENFRKKKNLPEDAILVIVRPPAWWTAYHRYGSDLFDALLERLIAARDVYVLLFPRIQSQEEAFSKLSAVNVHLARRNYDAANLLYHSDLVISAGGTMNREAAVLGTPAFSVFSGKQTATDNLLVEMGRMSRIATREQINQLPLLRKDYMQPPWYNAKLASQITDQILGDL